MNEIMIDAANDSRIEVIDETAETWGSLEEKLLSAITNSMQ